MAGLLGSNAIDVTALEVFSEPEDAGRRPAGRPRSPAAVATGQAVAFDASSFSDPDAQIAAYAWDFEGDGSVDYHDERRRPRATPIGGRRVHAQGHRARRGRRGQRLDDRQGRGAERPAAGDRAAAGRARPHRAPRSSRSLAQAARGASRSARHAAGALLSLRGTVTSTRKLARKLRRAHQDAHHREPLGRLDAAPDREAAEVRVASAAEAAGCGRAGRSRRASPRPTPTAAAARTETRTLRIRR